MNSSFFGYIDGLKDPRFKSCERIYTIDVFGVPSLPNCSSVENIFERLGICSGYLIPNNRSLFFILFALYKFGMTSQF